MSEPAGLPGTSSTVLETLILDAFVMLTLYCLWATHAVITQMKIAEQCDFFVN